MGSLHIWVAYHLSIFALGLTGKIQSLWGKSYKYEKVWDLSSTIVSLILPTQFFYLTKKINIKCCPSFTWQREIICAHSGLHYKYLKFKQSKGDY